MHPIYGDLRPLNVIEADINKSTGRIKDLEDQQDKNHSLNKKYHSQLTDSKTKLTELDTKDGGYVHRKGTYYAANDRIKELQWELKSKQEKISHHQGQSGILDRHDWFDTNDTCKKCSFLTGAFHSRRLVEEENILLKSLEEEYEDKRKELEEYKDFPKEEKLYEKCEKEVSDLESKLQNLAMATENITLQLELEKNKLTSYKEELKTYKKNEISIKHNRKVDRELQEIESNLANAEVSLRDNNDDITKNNTLLGQITQRITDLGGNIEVLKEIEKKYAMHELLMEAFGNDGIPLMIMNRAVPLINNEIRKILSNVTNFEVFLEVDTEAHDLMIFIDDGTSRRRVELGSGMEKTITALTIRSALSNISLLPTCNLFVIDEGFGTLDSENINHMNMLLGYLKSKFESVLIISHIESMQDITNNVININKNEKGYSSIKIL